MSNKAFKSSKYVSRKTQDELVSYIEHHNYELVRVDECPTAPLPIADHPDIQMCRLGYLPDSPLVMANFNEIGDIYPDDCHYNAACTGKYFIHNLDVTSPALLKAAQDLGMIFVNVKQAYTKCSCVIVDEDSIITYDKGIALPCIQAGMNVLLVHPGHVELTGYDTGFIGGCSGRVDDILLFNGNLSLHPDFEQILSFIASRGLKCKWFEAWPLTDIGSIV